MAPRQFTKAFRGVVVIAWCVGAIAVFSAIERRLRSLYEVLSDH